MPRRRRNPKKACLIQCYMRILIVCRAGDDLGLQARQGIVVNDGAERAGDEYLNWGIVNSIGRDRCHTESALGLAHAAIMDITNQKDSAGIAEASRQVPADIPEPLYGDADTLQIVMAEALPHGRRCHLLEDLRRRGGLRG